MGKKCDIVRDLMPMCIDGTASEAGRKYVEAHVSDCKPCKAVYSEMKAAVVIEPPKEDPAFAEAVRTMQQRRKRRTWRSVLVGMILALAGAAALLTGYYWYFADEVMVVPSVDDAHTFYQNLGGSGTFFVCSRGIPDGARMRIEVTPNDYDGDGVYRHEAYISYWTTRAEMDAPESDARYIIGSIDAGEVYISSDAGEKVRIDQILYGSCRQGGQLIYQPGRKLLFGDMFGHTIRTPQQICWNTADQSNVSHLRTENPGDNGSQGVIVYATLVPAADDWQ